MTPADQIIWNLERRHYYAAVSGISRALSCNFSLLDRIDILTAFHYGIDWIGENAKNEILQMTSFQSFVSIVDSWEDAWLNAVDQNPTIIRSYYGRNDLVKSLKAILQ